MLVEFAMFDEPSVWVSTDQVIALEKAEEGTLIYLMDNMLYHSSDPLELAVKRINFAGMLFEPTEGGC
jgi:hypothetical protein